MVLYVTTHIFVVFSIFFDFLSEWIFKLFQVFLSVMNFLVFFWFFFKLFFYHNLFIIVERILSTLPNFWPVLQKKKFFGGEVQLWNNEPTYHCLKQFLYILYGLHLHQQTYFLWVPKANDLSALNKKVKQEEG